MPRSRPGSGRPESRVGGDRPVPAPRRGSATEKESFMIDCRAAYLAVFDDLHVEIESKQDLCKVLQQAGRSPTNRMLSKYWKTTTDSLTFDDFCDICRSEPATTEDDLLKAFRKIDINGDGYITNSELQKMLTTRGEKMTVKEVQAIIDEVDENGDGKLNYREFVKMIMKTQDECKALAYRNMERKMATTSTHKSQPSPRTSHIAIAVNKNSDDDSSDGDIVIGTSRSASRRSDITVRSGEPSKSSVLARETREWQKSALGAKQLNLTKPKTLREWKVSRSKGGFFFGENSRVICHQYSLKVTQDSNVWVTIEPLCIKPGGDLNSMCEVNGSPMDVIVFVLNADDSLVAFSDQRDAKGKSALSCELPKGTYKIIPFTTGCRFRRRSSEGHQKSELVRRKDGKVTLTKPFKEALFSIFEMCDLTGNSMWSRDEFKLYNLLTSEEELGDEEWQIVEEKCEMSNGQLTRQGFINLIQMEAEDQDEQDQDDELWITLNSFGFNNALVMDEASPFLLEVFADKCTPTLKVLKLETGGRTVTNAVTEMCIRKGEESRVKGSKDLVMYSYVNDFRVCLLIENRNSSKQSVTVDCRKSQNVTSSHHSGLLCTVDVGGKSAVVAHHLLPVKESQPWSVVCTEVVK